MERLIDRLTGKGWLTTDGYPEQEAFYDINVFEDVLIVGRTKEEVAGLKSYKVSLDSISEIREGEATLILKDGSTIRLLIYGDSITVLSGPDITG
jgi:hypothetical protein